MMATMRRPLRVKQKPFKITGKHIVRAISPSLQPQQLTTKPTGAEDNSPMEYQVVVELTPDGIWREILDATICDDNSVESEAETVQLYEREVLYRIGVKQYINGVTKNTFFERPLKFTHEGRIVDKWDEELKHLDKLLEDLIEEVDLDHIVETITSPYPCDPSDENGYMDGGKDKFYYCSAVRAPFITERGLQHYHYYKNIRGANFTHGPQRY